MDVHFESSYERNDAVIKELTRYHYLSSLETVVTYIVMVILFVANLILVCFNGLHHTQFICFMLCFVFAVMQVINYRRDVKRTIARDRETYGEQPVRVYMQVTEDRLIGKSSTGTEGETLFGNIRYAVETKNLVILLTRARQYHVMQKDAFTKGDWKEFLCFLEERGVKVRR